MDPKNKYSVILPTYNERKNLPIKGNVEPDRLVLTETNPTTWF